MRYYGDIDGPRGVHSRLTNVALYSYYYRYREIRKQCKTLVDTSDYQNAKTKLDSAIAEHHTKYGPTKTMKLEKPDFNYGERIAMEHAQRHLNTVINEDDPEFYEADMITLRHQSDMVKQALTHIPKSDYSET